MGQFPQILEEISDLTRENVEVLLRRAKRIKEGYLTSTVQTNSPAGRHSTFQDATVVTYFSENSTRTKISFMQAILNLGLRHINFDVHLSSVQKGESLKETLLTLKHMGTDMVIYRTNKDSEIKSLKSDPPMKIINAGDGTNEHPTQALLDLFTMIENGHNPKGKTISIVGDCIHSRVCHSLTEILGMWGAKVILCGPENMLSEKLIEKSNYKEQISFSTNLQQTIEKSDVLYPLRIQFERHGEGFDNEEDFAVKYHQEFGINLEKLKAQNKIIPVYHAGPANIGIEISQDIVDSELYMGYSQNEHSVPMRTAIIRSLMEEERDGKGL